MSGTSSQGSSALTAFPHSQKLLLERQLAGPGAASGEALSPPGSCSPHTRPKCVTEGGRLVCPARHSNAGSEPGDIRGSSTAGKESRARDEPSPSLSCNMANKALAPQQGMATAGHHGSPNTFPCLLQGHAPCKTTGAPQDHTGTAEPCTFPREGTTPPARDSTSIPSQEKGRPQPLMCCPPASPAWLQPELRGDAGTRLLMVIQGDGKRRADPGEPTPRARALQGCWAAFLPREGLSPLVMVTSAAATALPCSCPAPATLTCDVT